MLMAEKKKRLRPTQLHFYVNDQELDLINQKMALYGTENMSAYLRKMAIDGYVIRLDLREIHELTSQMKRIANSEYFIAQHPHGIEGYIGVPYCVVIKIPQCIKIGVPIPCDEGMAFFCRICWPDGFLTVHEHL